MIQITLGKKLAEYCITLIYKPSFHCSSKFVKNSTESNINLLPEHGKSLHFFGVGPTASSYIQKNSELENIFNMLDITDNFFLRFSFLRNIVCTLCISML